MREPVDGAARRKRRVRIAVTMTCLLVAGLAVSGQRKYVGYCATQGRVLSDAEMIRSALNNNSSLIARSGASSIEEFQARNPDCCTVYPTSLYSPQNLLEKLVFGRRSTVGILARVPPEVHAGVRYSRYEMLADTWPCGEPGSAFGDAVADK